MTMLADKFAGGAVKAERTERTNSLRLVNPNPNYVTPEHLIEIEQAIAQLPDDARKLANAVYHNTLNAIARRMTDINDAGYTFDLDYPRLATSPVEYEAPPTMPTIVSSSKRRPTKQRPKRKPKPVTVERPGVVLNAERPFNMHAERNGSRVNISSKPFA